MNAPNRLSEINTIWGQFHLQPITDDALRFEKNLKVIIRELNKIDGGNWGFLKKLDQGGKIPTDILCWRDTKEIFDVLLGTTGEPCWNALGLVTNSNWVWEAYIAPTDPPVDNGGDIVDLSDLIKPLLDKLDEVKVSVDTLRVAIVDLNTNGIKVKLRL